MKDTLLKQSKTKLLDLIKFRGEVSVDEATQKLGFAKATIRQHLLALERQKLITRSERKIGRGRPQLVYKLSNKATPLFPTQEPALLGELLKWLITGGHKDEVYKFFASYWEQRSLKFKKYFQNGEKVTPKKARKVLLEILEAEGFMPKISINSSQALVIKECNCPFAEIVKVTNIPCRLEAEFLKNALQMDFERVSYIPSGATTCTYKSKPS